MWRDAYLSGEIGSVDAGSAAEPVIELDLGVFGAAAVGGPHCHRHWSRSQKQLAVCWCGGSSGRYGAGCGVAVVGCDEMAVLPWGGVGSGCGCEPVGGLDVGVRIRRSCRPDFRRASTDCLRAPGPVPRSALGFVASPEPVPVGQRGGQAAGCPGSGARRVPRGTPRAAAPGAAASSAEQRQGLGRSTQGGRAHQWKPRTRQPRGRA